MSKPCDKCGGHRWAHDGYCLTLECAGKSCDPMWQMSQIIEDTAAMEVMPGMGDLSLPWGRSHDDPTNLPARSKSLLDAMKRLGWIIDDTAEWCECLVVEARGEVKETRISVMDYVTARDIADAFHSASTCDECFRRHEDCEEPSSIRKRSAS